MTKFLVVVFVFFTFPCFAGDYARNFLEVVLNNMEERYQHSIGVPLGRYEVYVNDDGREFVYDTAKKKPVEDPTNKGDYNYYQYEQGVKHFIYDRYPWLNLGNAREDPSSYQDRLNAWMDDFEASFKKVCRKQSKLLKKSKKSFKEDKIFANMMEKIFSEFLSDERVEKLLYSNPCGVIEASDMGNKKKLHYIMKVLRKDFKDGPLTEAQMNLYFAIIPKPKQLK